MDFLYLYSEKADCSGGAIINLPKEVDVCGICGGDGGSCTDCFGVVNGSAVFDPCQDHCVANEGELTPRDCLGNCDDSYHIVMVQGNELCLPKNSSGLSSCDGQEDSTAFINKYFLASQILTKKVV